MMTDRAKGAVAAGHRLTAETAAGILRDGGNAIDAAVAGLAMACVCEPVLASPGGGGFAMIRDGKDGTTALVDFFPQTPIERRVPDGDGVYEILADFGTATQAFHIGPATTASPGFFAGTELLCSNWGTQPLPELFRTATRAARDGVVVTDYQNYLSNVVAPILTATPEAAELFAPGGTLIEAGKQFRNPGLADAFEAMAADGFADSNVGRQVAATQAGRGHLAARDLAAYRAIRREPLTIGIGEARAHLNPLPAASGPLIAYALAGLDGTGAVEFARALADTDMARRQAGGDLGKLLERPIRQRGTTHISVLDAFGNACAVTVSNGEGNGELVGPFGFMLNNILGEEDVNPFGPAGWPQDTRLSSMMCPALLETPEGGLIALGSGGSSRIRSAMLQVIARLALDDVELAEAVTAPRLHVEAGHLDFEDFHDPQMSETLKTAFPDHRAWPEQNMFFGGVHAVAASPDGVFSGVGDRRRDGVAIVVD